MPLFFICGRVYYIYCALTFEHNKENHLLVIIFSLLLNFFFLRKYEYEDQKIQKQLNIAE